MAVPSDDFNRLSSGLLSTSPVSSSGHTWLGATGNFSFSSGRLAVSGSGNFAVYFDMGATTYKVEVETYGQFIGLFLRGASSTNGLWFTGKGELYDLPAGTLLGTVPYGWVLGDIMRAAVTPTAIEFFRNGISVGTIATTVKASNTFAGLHANQKSEQYDNFNVVPLTEPGGWMVGACQIGG